MKTSSGLDEVKELRARMETLERQNDRLGRRQKIMALVIVTMAIVPFVAAYTIRPDFAEDVLTVRGLNVVDANGILRIELSGGPVTPDPPIYGRRFRRHGSPGASILFYNAGGMEQGGLSIPDDGGISLGMDSKAGQHVSIGTSSDGRSAAIRFWTVVGGERQSATIGVSAERGGLLRLVHDGETIFQMPRAEAQSDDGTADHE